MIEVHSATDFEPRVDEARKNLSPEISAWDFGAVPLATEKVWAENPSRVGIEPANSNIRQTCFAALHDVMSVPAICRDADGWLYGPNGQVHFTPGFKYCSIFFPWGTFRAEQPLLTVIQPERVNDFSSGNYDGALMSIGHVRSAPALNPVNPLAGNYVVDSRLREKTLRV